MVVMKTVRKAITIFPKRKRIIISSLENIFYKINAGLMFNHQLLGKKGYLFNLCN
tara:strand:- start:1323 stop:1487 length:165 start_codon:yes stop_codon:yes gene_type:complete